MTSAIFDFEAIGHHLAQMRGEAPNGRVFERNRHSGKYHDCSSTHDFCLGPTQACSRCAATYEEVLDHVAPKACPGSTEAWAAWHKVNVAERGGHPRPRPTNWRMTQHLAAEAGTRPREPDNYTTIQRRVVVAPPTPDQAEYLRSIICGAGDAPPTTGVNDPYWIDDPAEKAAYREACRLRQERWEKRAADIDKLTNGADRT